MGHKKEKYIVQIQNLLNEQIGKLFYMTQAGFSEKDGEPWASSLALGGSYFNPGTHFMLCDVYSVFNNTQEPLTDEASMIELKTLRGASVHFLWLHYKDFNISDNGVVACNSFKRLGQ